MIVGSLDATGISILFFSLALLLGAARVMGELARRLRQPAVLGEILAGVLLGPTVFGALAPDSFASIFPSTGGGAVALQGITTLCVALFMLVAGMEIDFSSIVRLRKSALLIASCGISVPFVTGFLLGRFASEWVGMEPGADPLAFSLFLGIALSIAALPVIAKILMDLNLYRSDLGMVVVASAVVHDLVGWLVFAVVLALIHAGGAVHGGAGATAAAPSLLTSGGGVGLTIVMTLVFAALMLTVGRWAIDRLLPWIQAHTQWPAGVLSFAITLGLAGAATTEWIGVHAIFGAFLVGVAIGDSDHLEQRTRATVEQFIASVFAPIFFASIGLKVDFVANFDASLVATILLIACAGEALGSSLGARLAGFPGRQAWAIGFALNARGAMEIVLAMLALQAGVIGPRLFVALVIMALVTTVVAGPIMQWVLRRPRPARLRDHLTAKTFLPYIVAPTNESAIRRMAVAAAPVAGLSADAIHEAVWERERTMPTSLPNGLAVPHGRVVGLERPLVLVAIAPAGVSFDARDGQLSRLIVMVLTPAEAHQAQLELLADIARTFGRKEVIDRAVACGGFTRFLAMLNMEGGDSARA
ncbi:MAG: hypothetical protein FJ253_03665 [Phycisphaerae bacterium]|nr:hypothetical protein [Phycisphaerae bacterium]